MCRNRITVSYRGRGRRVWNLTSLLPVIENKRIVYGLACYAKVKVCGLDTFHRLVLLLARSSLEMDFRLTFKLTSKDGSNRSRYSRQLNDRVYLSVIKPQSDWVQHKYIFTVFFCTFTDSVLIKSRPQSNGILQKHIVNNVIIFD